MLTYRSRKCDYAGNGWLRAGDVIPRMALGTMLCGSGKQAQGRGCPGRISDCHGLRGGNRRAGSPALGAAVTMARADRLQGRCVGAGMRGLRVGAGGRASTGGLAAVGCEVEEKERVRVEGSCLARSATRILPFRMVHGPRHSLRSRSNRGQSQRPRPRSPPHMMSAPSYSTSCLQRPAGALPLSIAHSTRRTLQKWLPTTTGSTDKCRASLQAPAGSWAASSTARATASLAWVEALATGALPSLLGQPHDFCGNPFICPRADSNSNFRIASTTRGWGDGVRGYGNGVKDATRASGPRAPTATNPLGLPGGSTQSAAMLKSKTKAITSGSAGGSASNPLGLK